LEGIVSFPLEDYTLLYSLEGVFSTSFPLEGLVVSQNPWRVFVYFLWRIIHHDVLCRVYFASISLYRL